MKGNNLHTKEIFEKAYRDRNWEFYRGILAECIRYGEPGLWLDLGAGLGFLLNALIGLELSA